MKKFATIAALLGIFVSYQNCAPNTNGLHSSPAELTTQIPSSYNKIPAQSFQSLSVWDSAHAQFLDVDLQNGKIAAFTDGGQSVGGNYCLTSDMQKSLEQILSSAQICQPVVDPQQFANQVCAMVYTFPYASLMGAGNVEYRLGEKTDSCEVPVDLCGSAAADLKSWSTNLLAQLSNLSCQ